jgi:DNA-binding GntR family transcriptional regulator
MASLGLNSVEQIYVDALHGNTIELTGPMSPQVYTVLRQAIIQGRLPPGSAIFEAKLADIMGVSRTPLRSALQQLAKEGLVVTRPQVGSIVAPVDKKKIFSAVFCREALETATVKRLVDIGTFNRSRFARIIAIQAECVERDDYFAFFDVDEEFHELLAEQAGVPEAWQLVLSNKTHVDRARMQLQSEIPGRARTAYKQHLDILDALGKGDASAAVAHMRYHVTSPLDIFSTE